MKAADEFGELLKGRVPEAARAKLRHYLVELERWSRAHSLVRFRERRELVERHILESLAALPLLPEEGVLLDIGSGAGLPGIPLLCCLPAWGGVLLEPRTRKWAFLRQMIRELGLEAEARCEGWEEHRGGNYMAILSRALGGHAEMAEWGRERIGSEGSLFFWVTEREEFLLRGLSGWIVLGYPIDGLRTGRLVQMRPGMIPAREAGADR